jgi:hypothetical protein
VKGCARNQRKFTRSRDCWTLPEHGVALSLYRVQDLLTTPREQFNVQSQFATHLANQRQTAIEPFAGTLNFEAHQFDEFWRVLLARNFGFGNAIPAQVFERKIDPAFLEVGADVLPKICELQRSTGVVRKLLAPAIVISAETEDQVSYRIR